MPYIKIDDSLKQKYDAACAAAAQQAWDMLVKGVTYACYVYVKRASGDTWGDVRVVTEDESPEGYLLADCRPIRGNLTKSQILNRIREMNLPIIGA